MKLSSKHATDGASKAGNKKGTIVNEHGAMIFDKIVKIACNPGREKLTVTLLERLSRKCDTTFRQSQD